MKLLNPTVDFCGAIATLGWYNGMSVVQGHSEYLDVNVIAQPVVAYLPAPEANDKTAVLVNKIMPFQNKTKVKVAQ